MGTLYLSRLLNQNTIIFFLTGVILLLFIWNNMLRKRVDTKTRYLKAQMEENRVLYQTLVEKERQKKDYFLNLSHELRTPLHVILSALQLQQDSGGTLTLEELEARNERIGSLIKGNSYRLLRVINNLIDVNKLDGQALSLKARPVNLGKETRKIYEAVKPWFQRKAVRISYEEMSSNLTTACDVEGFERVLLNLLSNALKFTPSGGDVLITAVRNRITGGIVLSVKDTGAGVPEEEHQRIFEKYLQLDRQLIRNTEGNGLGLAVVKGIVELEGGTVHLISAPGQGAEFRITYPVKEAGTPDIDSGSVHRETLDYHVRMEFSELLPD